MKRVFFLVILSCFCVVGCKGAEYKKPASSTKHFRSLEDQMHDMDEAVDSLHRDIRQLRLHLAQMSKSEYSKAKASIVSQIEQVNAKMEKLNGTLKGSSQQIRDEVSHFWDGSKSMMNRSIAHMESSMQEMSDIGEEKGREQMHRAIDSMSNSLRSMQNSLNMMKKKVEKAG